MRILLVIGVVGHLARNFALAFLPPLVLALFDSDHDAAIRFGASAVATVAAGALLSRGYRGSPSFHRSEAFAVVAFTWLFLAALAAVPYLLTGLSPVDALFESVSGLTTTGATILTDFDAYSRAFFLWRAMTQWFGGLGVIALFVVVLPRLGIAGRQLFFAEATGDTADALSPKVRNNAARLWLVYCGLTLSLVAALYAAGMSPYDAFVHALTTLSAGGFSPNGQSIAGYANPTAEWVFVPFMLLSGASFTLQYRVFSGKLGELVRDGEFVLYVAVMGLAGLAAALLLHPGAFTEQSLRLGFFQVASLMSSTGYASADFNLWSDSLKAVLVVVMVVGGCAGSAAGGPKVIRLLLLGKHVVREIRRTLYPRAVLPLRYKLRPVSDEIMRSVFTLVALYAVGYFALGTALTLLGADLVLAFSAGLACLGNIGPGFGAAGPMGSFAGFDTPSKLLLTAAMWVGRLEIVAVLALLQSDVWRRLRLR